MTSSSASTQAAPAQASQEPVYTTASGHTTPVKSRSLTDEEKASAKLQAERTAAEQRQDGDYNPMEDPTTRPSVQPRTEDPTHGQLPPAPSPLLGGDDYALALRYALGEGTSLAPIPERK